MLCVLKPWALCQRHGARRSYYPLAVRLFQDPALLAQPGDRAFMDARERILLRAPDAAAVTDAYFAAPIHDLSIQEKVTCRIASREHARLLLWQP